MKIRIIIGVVFLALICQITCMADSTEQTRVVIDSFGREVIIPAEVDSVICSGAGGLRYLTYLQMQHKIIGVDSIDIGDPGGRPYAMAHPEFQSLPLIGDFKGAGHGSDNLEMIISLQPDVIIKTYDTVENIEKEEEKLGIPIVYLEYGDLGVYRDDFYSSLRILGTVTGAEERAEEVIAFFDEQIADLNARTSTKEANPSLEYGDLGVYRDDFYSSLRILGTVTGAEERAEEVIAFFDEQIADLNARTSTKEANPSVYVGGVAYYGAMGIESTEPAYPPFMLTNVENIASGMGTEHVQVAKEKLIEWDPDYFFLDLGCKDLDRLNEGVVFPRLSAVKRRDVYGLVPYNSYTTNQDTVLANAYYIGTVLYPDQFTGIDPKKKADEIYSFLVGKPVFDELNERYHGMALSQLDVTQERTP